MSRDDDKLGFVRLGRNNEDVYSVLKGDYTITVKARENRTGPIIGCVEVNATVAGQGGSIFG